MIFCGIAGARHDHLLHGAVRDMEIVRIGIRDVAVALCAYERLRECRITFHPRVSRFPVRIVRVSAMAGHARNVPVIGVFFDKIAVDEELEKRDRKIEELSRLLPPEERFFGMVGQSRAMRRIYALIEKAARSEAPVLIHGESGTGKELVANAIHQLSARAEGPFIQLNCAALNEFLLESELFGHVKGAFTGAYRHRTGRFEAANGGNIFLDEIGEMPPASQAKLLRVIENKKIERVGDHTPIRVDARIIGATNRNLSEMVERKQFREDLFFRINVIPIHLPTLRERMEDVPVLADAIMRDLAKRSGKNITGLSKSALDLLLSYTWAGNVRELKSALEFAFVVAESGLIQPEHLPNHLLPVRKESEGITGREASSEKTELISALKKAGGNRSETARLLGVTRATVWNRMRKYNIIMDREIRMA